MPDPLDTAVTTPFGLTEKTSGALPVQVTVPENGAPYWSARVAVNTVVSPTKVRVALEGDTAIDGRPRRYGCRRLRGWVATANDRAQKSGQEEWTVP